MTIITQPLRTLQPHMVTDCNGYVRLVVYILMLYMADLEEQYMIAGLAKDNCPHCLAGFSDLGSCSVCAPRTGDSILADIARVNAVMARKGRSSPYDFHLVTQSEKLKLCGVDSPFWSSLPFVDICRVLCQDLLHGYHKFFYDHPHQWNIETVGEREMDRRIMAQPNQVGARRFPKGKS